MKKTWINFNPTKIHFGVGAFKNAKELFEHFEAKKIFLVTGKHAMKKTGHTDQLIDMLKPAEVTLFDEVEPNPLLETGQKGVGILRELKPDLVIGLGGGSAIDAAKAMAITAQHEGSLADYFTGKKDYFHKGLPFVAISSTPGSSSEMTCWSVFTYQGMKNGYGMHLMYPEKAIVDPELTLTLPPYQTGATGFDILSHSIEAFWSKNATPVSDANALRAIELVFNHLPKTVNNLSDINERKQMSLASVFAAMAFSQTVTTSVHVASYPVTVKHGAAHGHACGLFLPAFFDFFYDKAPKLKQLLPAMHASSKRVAVENLRQLLKDAGLKHNLSLVGVKEKELDEIAAYLAERPRSNPVNPTEAEFRQMLEKSFK